MDKATELERAEREIEDLRDRIAFYRRKSDDLDWRRKQIIDSDPKEAERLLGQIKECNEYFLEASIRMGYQTGVADELAEQLRHDLKASDTDLTEPNDASALELKPKKPKPKR